MAKKNKNKYKNKKASTSRGNWETSSYPADADTNEWDENSPPAAEAATMSNIIQFPTQPKTEEKELLNQHGNPLNTQRLLPPASTPSAEESKAKRIEAASSPQPATQATQEAPAEPATQSTKTAPSPQPTTQSTKEAPSPQPATQSTKTAPSPQPTTQSTKEAPTTQSTKEAPTTQPTAEIQAQRIQSALLSDLQGIFRWWLLIGFLATIAIPSWMTLGGLSIYLLCAFGAFAIFLKHSFIGFKTPQYFR
jgi:hypothetical protein